MATAVKTKKTFGTIAIDHINEGAKAINVHVSFEEALKLHLGLSQILGRLNSYNRSTAAGPKAAVNLCIFRDTGYLTINEGNVRS